MSDSLIPINGISKTIGAKLAKEGISGVSALLEKAATPKARAALAATLKTSEKTVYNWVKQAELMRVPSMDNDTAYILTMIGVRDVEDLSRLDADVALRLMTTVNNAVSPVKTLVSKEKLVELKNRAVLLRPVIVRDVSDSLPVAVLPPVEPAADDEPPATRVPVENYFYDVGDVISSVGRGIAEAQHALDISAIRTQQEINLDDDLPLWGLSAQWYTIPEATVNLKMDYQFSAEKVEEGEVKTGTAVKKARLLVSPINAKYTNTFKVSSSLQSEINLKFLPIPPPTRWTEQVTVPDLAGLTLDEAKEALKLAGLKTGDVKSRDAATEEERIVASQTPPANARAWLTDKVNITLAPAPGVDEPETPPSPDPADDGPEVSPPTDADEPEAPPLTDPDDEDDV